MTLPAQCADNLFPRVRSVFPHKSDDVVVEPYNSVLTLKRLKHHAHAVTVLVGQA